MRCLNISAQASPCSHIRAGYTEARTPQRVLGIRKFLYKYWRAIAIVGRDPATFDDAVSARNARSLHVYLEPAARSAEENRIYCLKAPVEVPDGRLNVLTCGEPGAGQGNRVDIHEIRRLVVETGRSPGELVRSGQVTCLQHLQFAEGLFKYVPQPPIARPTPIWIYGGSGIGKSRWLRQNLPIDDVYWIPPPKKGGSVWYSHYCGQRILVFDDLRTDWIRGESLLRLCDGTFVIGEIKGSTVPLRNVRVIVVTALEGPADFAARWGEDATQFTRRFGVDGGGATVWARPASNEWRATIMQLLPVYLERARRRGRAHGALPARRDPPEDPELEHAAEVDSEEEPSQESDEEVARARFSSGESGSSSGEDPSRRIPGPLRRPLQQFDERRRIEIAKERSRPSGGIARNWFVDDEADDGGGAADGPEQPEVYWDSEEANLMRQFVDSDEEAQADGGNFHRRVYAALEQESDDGLSSVESFELAPAGKRARNADARQGKGKGKAVDHDEVD